MTLSTKENPLSQTLSHWRTAFAIDVNSPCSDSTISAAEERLGLELPEALTALYKCFDGMEGIGNHALFRFYPLEEMLQAYEEQEPKLPFSVMLPIGDFMIASYLLYLCIEDVPVPFFSRWSAEERFVRAAIYRDAGWPFVFERSADDLKGFLLAFLHEEETQESAQRLPK